MNNLYFLKTFVQSEIDDLYTLSSIFQILSNLTKSYQTIFKSFLNILELNHLLIFFIEKFSISFNIQKTELRSQIANFHTMSQSLQRPIEMFFINYLKILK